MNQLRLWAAAVAACVSVNAMGEDSFASALSQGDPGIDLRYRYEHVDQSAIPDEAHASTLRVRFNYKTGLWRGWSGFFEFDHVAELLLDDFNSGAGTSSARRNRYPLVADPNGSDLNQLYFDYVPGGQWHVRFGRQRITLDNQRFIGAVGWRQNEQTYDGVLVKYSGIEAFTLTYGYVANANRIFGSEVAAGDHDQDTHLFNAGYRFSDTWKLAAYGYFIDNDDAPAFSTNTFGINAKGDLPMARGRLNLYAELARQSDAANSPASYDAGYFHLLGEWSAERLSLGAGFESLGADNNQGFRTPLATLHGFNGWADQFTTTPGGGLEDLYFKVGYDLPAWKLNAVFHDFSAESDGSGYGRELDLSAIRRLGDRYGVLLKAAWFEADAAAFTDTTKLWVMLTAKF